MVGLRRRWIVGRGRGASLPFAAIIYQGTSWSLLVIGDVGLASGQQGGFLLLYQYDERTLSSIRALCLLLLFWRNKRSADLAQGGFGLERFL